MPQVSTPARVPSHRRVKAAPGAAAGLPRPASLAQPPLSGWLLTPRVMGSLALGVLVLVLAASTGNRVFVPAAGYERNLGVSRLLMAALVVVLVYGLWPLVRRPRLPFLVIAGAWCAYLLLWLVATWPGFLMSDSVDVVVNARQLIVYEWFSYLHPVLTMGLLDVVPHVTVVAAVHIGLTATVLAWSSVLALDLGAPRWLLLSTNLALATSAPLITNTLLYSRDTVFALLHVLLALYVAMLVTTRRLGWPEAARLGTLVGFLSVYRGDGVALVVAVPVVLLAVLRPGRQAALQLVGGLAAGLVAFQLVLPALLAVREQPHAYELSLRLNPLGQVLQSDFYSPDRDKDLASLARVIDVEGVRAVSTPYEIPAYWEGKWRQDATEADWAAFTETTDRLLRDNASTVVAGRLRTFGAASGLSPNGFTGVDTAPVATRHAWVSDLRAMEGKPPSDALYAAAARYLDGTTAFRGLELSGTVLHWNVVPWLAVLVIALAVGRRHPAAAVTAAVLLCRLPLVFLAAPAAQFKYYYSAYLGGAVVLMLLLAGELHRRRTAGETAAT